MKSFCIVPLAKSSFRSGSARSFNTQYGHLSPESSADEAGEEDEVEEEPRAHHQKEVLVQELQKEERVRGRPERRKTQRIEEEDELDAELIRSLIGKLSIFNL